MGDKEKHAGGAPPKYKKEYCELVRDLGKDGKSITQIAVFIGVVKQTVYNWEKEYPEFLDALTRARENAQAWYEDIGQRGLIMGKDFNASTWAKQVSCRFPKDYTEKIKHDGEIIVKPFDVSDCTDEELEKLEKLSNQLSRKNPESPSES